MRVGFVMPMASHSVGSGSSALLMSGARSMGYRYFDVCVDVYVDTFFSASESGLPSPQLA